MTRIRTRSSSRNGSYIKLKGEVVLSTLRDLEYCEDIDTSPGIDHPFYVRKLLNSGEWKGNNGATPGSISYVSLNSYPMVMPSILPHLSVPYPNVTEAATRIAAGSNPASPHVPLPNSVFELRELPGMLKNVGFRKLNRIGKVAYATLAYQFGWKPLVQDLYAMTEFTAAAEERLQQLDNLADSGGQKVNRTFSSDSSESKLGTEYIASQPFIATGDKTITTERKCWVSLRWVPQPSWKLQHGNSSKNLATIRSLLGGYHRSQIPSVLWNAIPWTWLIDWVANVNDAITASNNTVAYLANTPNVMVKTTTKATWDNLDKPSWANLYDPHQTYEEKERFLVPTGLTASLPILSNRKLAILGSLSALRSHGLTRK